MTGWKDSKALVSCATQTNLNDVSDPPFPKVAQGESMTVPHKKGSQATLPCPQITEITNKLGKCISWDALIVNNLGW